MSSRPSVAPTRRRRRHPTLRQRLARAFLLGLPGYVLGASLFLVAWDARARYAELAAHAGRTAEALAAEIESLPPGEVVDSTWLGIRLAGPLPGVVGVAGARLHAGDGTLVAAWPRVEHASGDGLLAPRVELALERGGRAAGTLRIDGDPRPVRAILVRGLVVGLSLVAVSIGIAQLLARRVHARFSTEILGLVHAVNAVSTRKDYSIRVVRHSEDEVGILVETLNHMIELVEQRDRQLQSEVERAEAASHAKAKFLATMSHEIRTPINGILGMTELLLDSSVGDEQSEYGHSIYGSAEGLLHVINDILDYSKLEAGQMRFEEAPFSVSDVVHDCLSTVATLAGDKGIELCCRVDDRIPPALIGDPMRLRQVLLNLVSNALKFSEAGEVAVAVRLEEAGREGCRLLFIVRDSGIGIPQDRLDRLFVSFSQVDASHSRKFGGTGLGLAICKQIVDGMGGEIFVETEVGVGSTFGFRLAFEEAEETAADDPVPIPTGLRVLVADPIETHRDDVAYALRRGNTVVTAGEAEAAWSALRGAVEDGEPFDAIVADLRLASELVPAGEEDLEPFVGSPLVLLVPVGRLRTGSVPGWRGRTISLGRPVRSEELAWCLAEVLSDEERARRAPRPSPSAPGTFVEMEGVRVLVAEDHPVNQRITTRFLERIGCAYELVDDGEAAVRAWEEGAFDVVLMDVQMPRMDGLEATREIRRRCAESDRHVWIVALTANALDEQARECFEAGCDDYVCKPFKLDALRERLEHWVREPRPALPPGGVEGAELAALMGERGERPKLRLVGEDRIGR